MLRKMSRHVKQELPWFIVRLECEEINRLHMPGHIQCEILWQCLTDGDLAFVVNPRSIIGSDRAGLTRCHVWLVTRSGTDSQGIGYRWVEAAGGFETL